MEESKGPSLAVPKPTSSFKQITSSPGKAKIQPAAYFNSQPLRPYSPNRNAGSAGGYSPGRSTGGAQGL